MRQSTLSRRRFLQLSAMSGTAIALAACVGLDPNAMAPAPAEEPAAEAAEEAAPEMDGEVEVMVSDVVDYVLESDDWAAPYGSVTFKFHEAMYNGESTYYIRTDTSNQAFAEEVGLVYVPLLATAAAMQGVNMMYQFSDDRPSVVAKVPGDENYSSLYKMIAVDGGSDMTLDSAEAVEAAIADGAVTAEDNNLFVNYPMIAWPSGSLSVDPELDGPPLKNGQLFAEPDMDNMTVTMKLHQCYPGSRYIVTDAGMMAPMMNVADASVTNQLKDLGGTDEIWVFGNGIPGPGVMGFQPAIFDHKAGDPAWSPFWDHFTLVWADEANARLLTNSDEVRAAVESGELEQFNGVPDSHPTGFVVNCPAPILAPNTFSA